MASLAEGPATWAIPWPCLHEFLNIVTHPRIYSPASPLARALEQVDAWLESPTLTLLADSASHWRLRIDICKASFWTTRSSAGGNMGRSDEIGCGSCPNTPAITLAAVLPSNARFPVAIS